MATTGMHADEVPTDVTLVRQLLAEQFPAWADRPVIPVASAGTQNALYRIGPDLAVRLPRHPGAVPAVAKEATWLPRLAPHLPWPAPEPVARGVAGAGYPFPWFGAAVGLDDATWARGRGWALSIALIQLPYYRHTNPALVASSRHVIAQTLAGGAAGW